jgi:hypothetical protein
VSSALVIAEVKTPGSDAGCLERPWRIQSSRDATMTIQSVLKEGASPFVTPHSRQLSSRLAVFCQIGKLLGYDSFDHLKGKSIKGSSPQGLYLTVFNSQ